MVLPSAKDIKPRINQKATADLLRRLQGAELEILESLFADGSFEIDVISVEALPNVAKASCFCCVLFSLSKGPC